MSASDKKKLRKEEAVKTMTAKQQQQKKETKKLKAYTLCFVVAILAIAIFGLYTLGRNVIVNNGLVERFTTAAVIGDHKLNSIELGYYYNEAVMEYYNAWVSEDYGTDALTEIVELDPGKPLNEQFYNKETKTTWADYFVDVAIDNAKHDYVMYDLAMEDGFTLSEERQEELDTLVTNLETNAMLYGYTNANQFMRAYYGAGYTVKNYRAYEERQMIAADYYNEHLNDIKYDDAKLREYEADKYDHYSSYTYDSVYLSYTYFQQGGTANENGTTTYSEEENAAARQALQVAADKLKTATTVEELEAMVEELEVKDGVTLGVTHTVRTLYTDLSASSAVLTDWVTDSARKDGDIDAIAVTHTSEVDGKEVTETNGYYIALFHSKDTNEYKLGSVRHLLVKFTGGTTDEATGEIVYSEEDKANTLSIAQGYLETWKAGPKTEDSFIELLLEYSEDSAEENQGLYSDISADSSYVDSFEAWAIDPARTVGETGIVETEYGYHIMYFSGHSELSYRDTMITEELRADDQTTWYNNAMEGVTAEKRNVTKMPLDLTLQ